MKIQDNKDIVSLNKNKMGYDYPAEDTRIRSELLLNDGNYKICVALVADKVVGYIHANNHDLIYAPHLKNIMGIAVAADFKKYGIGKILLTEIEEWHGIQVLVASDWYQENTNWSTCILFRVWIY